MGNRSPVLSRRIILSNGPGAAMAQSDEEPGGHQTAEDNTPVLPKRYGRHKAQKDGGVRECRGEGRGGGASILYLYKFYHVRLLGGMLIICWSLGECGATDLHPPPR